MDDLLRIHIDDEEREGRSKSAVVELQEIASPHVVVLEKRRPGLCAAARARALRGGGRAGQELTEHAGNVGDLSSRFQILNCDFQSNSGADERSGQHGLSAGHFHGGFRMLV